MQGFESFLPFIIMFVIFYFLLIRPQQKRNKQRNAMLAALKKGDKVITIGGMHGTIQDLNDNVVTLRVGHNVNVTFDRAAINTVVSSAPEPAAKSAESAKDSKEEPKEESK